MTTPTRRIRNARLRYARSHTAAYAQRLTARMRSKDIVISAIAQSAADAEAAADALRMERDAAHEECARLGVSGVAFRNIASVFEGLYTSAEADLASADSIAARLVQVICEDAEHIATLTAERDHARAIAVALEQDAASAFDELLARSEAVAAQIAAGVWSYMGVIEPGSVDPLLEAEQAGLVFALRTLTRVPMDSDRTAEVEG